MECYIQRNEKKNFYKLGLDSKNKQKKVVLSLSSTTLFNNF